MSTVSFRLFKLQEINVPVGVVTLLATTGDSASGSFVALLLSVKAKIANKEQAHKLKIILLFLAALASFTVHAQPPSQTVEQTVRQIYRDKSRLKQIEKQKNRRTRMLSWLSLIYLIISIIYAIALFCKADKI